MPLPVNVRPNPYQSLADQQWYDAGRADMITPHQGLNPRSVVGHPSMVAQHSLMADDIAYGQMPVANGIRSTNWEAAANARAAEASQTLALHGMLGTAYGRRSGVGNRSLRVRRMPVSTVAGLGNTYLPASDLHRGPAHYRGLGGGLEDMLDYDWSKCQEPDKDLRVAAAACVITAGWEKAIEVFGLAETACSLYFGIEGNVTVATDAAQANPEFMAALESAVAASGVNTGYLGTMSAAMVFGLYRGTDGDIEAMTRALAAGQRMADKGWWEKDGWEFKWKYLSGYTSWYKNPLILGGGALGGLGVYMLAKKKRR
jgi:hypothetical protein